MDAEVILDRRRLRRKTTFWRIIAFLFALLALLAGLAALTDGSLVPKRPHIARITVDGFIPVRPDSAELIRRASEARSVRAIIVRINSPGGAASGGELLYQTMVDAAAKKPVVAVIDGLGTSAAYMTALGASHIIARESSITGSIGVIFQYGHFEVLLEKIGAEFEEIKSAPLKGQPSPFNEPTPEARQMLQAVVDDTYDWFVGLVIKHREIARTKAFDLSDGSVFTGRQALAEKLVDALGGEKQARAWLKENHNLSDKMRVTDWYKRVSIFGSRPRSAIAGIARLLGFGDESYSAIESIVPERLMVDGLLSVWQASEVVRSGR